MNRKLVLMFAAALMAVSASTASAQTGMPGLETRGVLTGGFVFPAGLAFYPGVSLTFDAMSFDNGTLLAAGICMRGQLGYFTREDLWSAAAAGAGMFVTGEAVFGKLRLFLSPGFGFSFYSFSGDPAHYSTRDKSEIGFAGFAGGEWRWSETVSARIEAYLWSKYMSPNIAAGLSLALR